MSKKERPSMLHKKIKRLNASKEEFKERNREKAVTNKHLQGKVADLEVSRGEWKKKCLEQQQLCETLEKQLAVAQEETKLERERAEDLYFDLHEVKKKFRIWDH